jgi:hypothetical protein
MAAPEGHGAWRKAAGWFGWGLLAGVGYFALLPLLLGGGALLPIAVVAYEDGALEALISAAVGMLAVLLLAGTVSVPAAILFVAAVLLGVGLRRPLPLLRQLGPAFLLATVAIVCYFLLPAFFGGQQLQVTPQQAHALGQIFSLPTSEVRSITTQVGEMLPAVAPLYGGFMLFEGYYFARWVLMARGRSLPEIRAFMLWTAPEWLPPLYLVLFAGQLGSNLLGLAASWQRWLYFGVLWSEVPLIVIGLAVLSFWLMRFGVPVVIRIVVLGILVLTPAFAELLVWIGILDVFIDIRRIRGTTST